MLQQRSENATSVMSWGMNSFGMQSLSHGPSAGRIWLRICLAVIAIVSVHDAVLIVVNHEVMMEFEENPIGLWLLKIQGGDVRIFVAAKLLGTSLVVTFLGELFHIRKVLGLICATALASFQLVLLGYLTLG